MSTKEFFKKEHNAVERQKELADKGIKSHIMVDPMEGIYPSLQDFDGVELVIDDLPSKIESKVSGDYCMQNIYIYFLRMWYWNNL